MDSIVGKPRAYLYASGSAVYVGPEGTQLHDLQALGWRGLHEYHRLYPKALVYLQGCTEVPEEVLPSLLNNIALPEK